MNWAAVVCTPLRVLNFGTPMGLKPVKLYASELGLAVDPVVAGQQVTWVRPPIFAAWNLCAHHVPLLQRPLELWVCRMRMYCTSPLGAALGSSNAVPLRSPIPVLSICPGRHYICPGHLWDDLCMPCVFRDFAFWVEF